MEIQVNADLIRRFAEALESGQALDPGGRWGDEEIKAAALVFYIAMESHFLNLDRKIVGVRRDVSGFGAMNAFVARRQMAQFIEAVTSKIGIIRAGAITGELAIEVADKPSDEAPYVLKKKGH
jgi:hypothetical protein